MTTRLAVVSTSPFTDRILRCLASDPEGPEVAFHVGRRHSDIMTASLSRLQPIGARAGTLTDEPYFAGAAMVSPQGHHQDLWTFVQQFLRRDPAFANNPHRLANALDYADYFHILSDMMARELRSRNVDTVLFFNIPHLAYDTVLYQQARALGLRTLILTQSLFQARFMSLRRIEDLGRLPPCADVSSPALGISGEEALDLFYMPDTQTEALGAALNAKDWLNLLAYIFLKEPGLLRRPARVGALARRMTELKCRFPSWRDPFARFFHVSQFDYFETLAEFEPVEADVTRPYVYAPLQMQPEMTTSALGGRYHDQVLALEALSKILPPDVAIYVKENPKQGAFMRGPLMWHRLRRIRNLTVLPSGADTNELIKNALCVATVTGTAGWEAIRRGVPAVVFGQAWYGDFPGVTRYREDVAFDEIVAPFDHSRLEAVAGYFVSRLHLGVVDRHYARCAPTAGAGTEPTHASSAIRDLLLGRIEPTFPG
ncbi:MAG: hypothetical protein AAGA32_17085 [Pseudomonadota bacterium]